MAPTAIKLHEIQELRGSWPEGEKVGFVPTMGALHAGHLSLVELARKHADRVVVSIFVNPTQFGPGEDFEKYPRTLADDLEKLSSHNVDGVFIPDVAEVFPPDHDTRIVAGPLGDVLCGASRLGHFDGVLTVVSKLINIVRPDLMCFGKKDYQQLFLIKKMIADLNFNVDILSGETVREPDGLALSSRNRYLAGMETDRVSALGLIRALKKVEAAWSQGQRDAQALKRSGLDVISRCSGLELEYLEIRNQGDFLPVEGTADQATVVLIAGKVGDTRLIDNIELDI